MANTTFAKLAELSNKVFKEWNAKTVLVQSCSHEYEGEFDLEKREIDIPIYQNLSIHKTTIKESELKPAPIEFMKASTKRVVIDKGRYSHWGQTEIGKLLNSLSEEESEARKKLTNLWARDAEEELGIWAAKNATVLNFAYGGLQGASANVTKDNILTVLDILKAQAEANKMDYADFKLFASERFETLLRDKQISIDSLSNDETFRTGSVGIVNGVDVRKISIEPLVHRHATSKLVNSEFAIWKTADGIQYVVPYRNTIEYDLSKDQILLGGKGYQMVEYYDFFNIYPSRLYAVKLQYAGDGTTNAEFTNGNFPKIIPA